jgi:hypothetical protein
MNNSLHLVHGYSPAYFTQNFTNPAQIVLTFTPASASLTASATLLSGSPSGVGCAASGSVGDVFANFTVNGN